MPTSFSLDPARSRVGFSVRHLLVSKVHGRFSRFRGRVELDDADVPRSRVEAHIEVASVESGDRERDEYLRTSEFLDPAHHPELVFKSTRIEKAGRGRLQLTGDLTVRGVTRAVVLEVEPRGAQAYRAHGTIDRRDFQLRWGALVEAAGFMVGDKIEITLDVVLVPDVT